MSAPSARDLIYDWNVADGAVVWPTLAGVVDETLYEGLHAPAAIHANVEGRVALLRCMDALGVAAANLGALTERSAVDLVRLGRRVVAPGLSMALRWTVEAAEAGVARAARARDEVGASMGVALVLPSSELLQRVRGITPADLSRDLRAALQAARRQGLEASLVLADVARARPAGLRRIIATAAAEEVERICLWDSAGQASPDGARRLVSFVRGGLPDEGGRVSLGWFGGNDRDLALANALEAFRGGVDTLHGTALGLGHGAGSVAVDQLLVNLRLLEAIDTDLSPLKHYCDTAARVLGVDIPVNYPVFGGDAFRTATGVHAAAIIKARDRGDHWLADRVYSSVPAGDFGLSQIIDVGPMSGESNVVAWLRHNGHEPHADLVRRIIARAKASTRTLTADEIRTEIDAFGPVAQTSG